MSADDIRKELKERWAGTRAVELCFQIVDFVAKLPAGHSRMLTFKTITNITGKKSVDDDLLAAINILASTRIAALDSHAMFVDDDNEEYEIEPDDLALAHATGELIHPETGKGVPNYEEKVFPFFVPTDRFAAGK